MNSEPVYPHFSTSVWLPNGQRVFFTIPIDRYETAYEAALEFTNMLLSKGASSREPGLEAGEQREIITTVMRREKPSDGTPIIDMYTAWGDGGDEPWGTFKYMHMYLGTEESVNAFLSISGLKSLEQIPLYDAQAPLKRTHGKRHAKEVDVRTPFYIVKKQGAEKMGSDGKAFKPWEFVRFESTGDMSASTPPQATNDAPATTKASSQAKAAKTPVDTSTNDLSLVPFVPAGDKAWWPTLYQIATPLYDNPKHAVNSMQNMQKTGAIDYKTMTVAEAYAVVSAHINLGADV